MRVWLYGMRCVKGWRPEDYRAAVRERAPLTWPAGAVAPRGLRRITAGDELVLLFSKSYNPEPGIYGWGTVLGYDRAGGEVTFELQPPSDRLKAAPLWDETIHRLVDYIRTHPPRQTLWGLTAAEVRTLQHKLREHTEQLAAAV